MSAFVYKGNKTACISFPLGGIGSGCIGLAGDGRLIDWEIFNRPNKDSRNLFSHFAVKAELDGKTLDARVMHGDLRPPYVGVATDKLYTGYGFGPRRAELSGLPHFKETTFTGTFPFAKVEFLDDSFPGNVTLSAFNPFIPLMEDDSSIPAAFFTVSVSNTSHQDIDYTFCFSVGNPLPVKGAENVFGQCGGVSYIQLRNPSLADLDSSYGDLTLATDGRDFSFQQYWYRGSWCDDLTMFWHDFKAPGALKNRVYGPDAPHRNQDMASLAVHLHVKAGEKGEARFALTWHFPNQYNYWARDGKERGGWKNYYVRLFNDSHQSACYALKNWDRLYQQTHLFQQTLFSSSLPEAVLDAVSANISILKSPTCLRLENGEFYGWEGCHSYAGSCDGSCQHVWNYAYALPFLFPRLERSMRSLDFRFNQDETGRMQFRLQLPLGSPRGNFRACVDGQMGSVVKAYRDWKISGDDKWLAQLWPSIQKAIEYAWSPHNADGWDLDYDGVMEGRQHHTLDMELFGPGSWLNGFYLAALKAGSEMAAYLGDTKTAQQYLCLFEKGKQYSDTELFNGMYYFQKINLSDRHLLEKYNHGEALSGGTAIEAYWNDELCEIKYQYGEGCEIDQIIAQWHANLSGLGEIFDPAQTRKALQSIYAFNFKKSIREVFNPNRLYCLNDEGGAIICEWPEGAKRPVIPAPYNEECWPGCEYQVAAHMIMEGMVAEGMEIVRSVRDRYDGEKRNPWNEMECGSNYARSMSSWSLLHAFSGYVCDLVHDEITINPVSDGTYFFSTDTGWGCLKRDGSRTTIEVFMGELTLRSLFLPYANAVQAVRHSDNTIIFLHTSDQRLRFNCPIKLVRGASLTVEEI